MYLLLRYSFHPTLPLSCVGVKSSKPHLPFLLAPATIATENSSIVLAKLYVIFAMPVVVVVLAVSPHVP